jgi:hypothetical protein
MLNKIFKQCRLRADIDSVDRIKIVTWVPIKLAIVGRSIATNDTDYKWIVEEVSKHVITQRQILDRGM